MQPFIRSTTGNLFAQLGFDGKQLRDEVDASGIHTDRRTNALTATLAGDRRDAGGISNMNLGISVGRLDFDNDAAAIADASSAKIRGTYAKVSLSLARLQRLSGSNSVYLAINGQAADKNLDPSEQFFLGGPNSVRAYDVGSVGGAIGALASAEFRHSFAPLPFGVLQATAFIDSGVVQVYENAFDAGDNRASLSGIGMGLDWMGPRGWSATAGLAARIGGVPSLIGGDTASSRLWIELRKGFPGASKNL
jgi:hemolysin activation/secretion protein